LIEKAKKAGVGIHALADLHESIISKELKDNVFDRYLNNEFNSKTMGYIRKATNEKVFKDIPIDSAQMCLDEIIQSKPENYENVKTIVHKNRLIGGYHKSSHTSIHNSTLKHFDAIKENLTIQNYVQFLSQKQKDELKNFTHGIIRCLNSTIVTLSFPPEVKQVNKQK